MSFGYSSSGGGGSVRSVSAMNNSSTEIGFRFSRTRAVPGPPYARLCRRPRACCHAAAAGRGHQRLQVQGGHIGGHSPATGCAGWGGRVPHPKPHGGDEQFSFSNPIDLGV